jgi:hypothetical protein
MVYPLWGYNSLPLSYPLFILFLLGGNSCYTLSTLSYPVGVNQRWRGVPANPAFHLFHRRWKGGLAGKLDKECTTGGLGVCKTPSYVPAVQRFQSHSNLYQLCWYRLDRSWDRRFTPLIKWKGGYNKLD